ncbi:hypothetical protein BDN67DRAFT_967902 [Paxillus ammoniavirescens]|nr:hypothetical protein BDN67DRAFT_967902 [Paxillus ammoniavirescens]
MAVKETFRDKELSFNELKDMQITLEVIFAILLVPTVVLVVMQNELAALPMSILVPIYSYCVSHLILNIRGADRNRCSEDGLDNPDALPLAITTPTPEDPV